MEKKILNEGTKVKMKDTPVVGFASIFGCFEIGEEGIVKELHKEDKECGTNWYKVKFEGGIEVIPDAWFNVVDKPVTTKAEEAVEKESESDTVELTITFDKEGVDFKSNKDLKEDISDEEATVIYDLAHALYTMVGLDVDD